MSYENSFSTLENEATNYDILVDNIDPALTEIDFKELFSQYNVKKFYLGKSCFDSTKESDINNATQCGYLLLSNLDDIDNIIYNFNERKIGGYVLHVQTIPKNKHCLHITNIPQSYTNEDLKQLFLKYGEIIEFKVIKNEEGENVAFAHFQDELQAEKAKNDLSNTVPYNCNEPLIIQFANVKDIKMNSDLVSKNLHSDDISNDNNNIMISSNNNSHNININNIDNNDNNTSTNTNNDDDNNNNDNNNNDNNNNNIQSNVMNNNNTEQSENLNIPSDDTNINTNTNTNSNTTATNTNSQFSDANTLTNYYAMENNNSLVYQQYNNPVYNYDQWPNQWQNTTQSNSTYGPTRNTSIAATNHRFDPIGQTSQHQTNISENSIQPKQEPSNSHAESIQSSTLSQTMRPGGLSLSNVYVAFMPQLWKEQELRTAFEQFGTVNEVKIMYDKSTGQSRCAGFVHFDNGHDAEKAVSTMNGWTPPDGIAPLTCKFANVKSSTGGKSSITTTTSAAAARAAAASNFFAAMSYMDPSIVGYPMTSLPYGYHPFQYSYGYGQVHDTNAYQQYGATQQDPYHYHQPFQPS